MFTVLNSTIQVAWPTLGASIRFSFPTQESRVKTQDYLSQRAFES